MNIQIPLGRNLPVVLVLRHEQGHRFFALAKQANSPVILGDDIGQVDCDFFSDSAVFYKDKERVEIAYNSFHLLDEHPLVLQWLKERNLVKPSAQELFMSAFA